MAKFRYINLIIVFLAVNYCFAQTLSKETIVLKTELGILKLKLYEETPLHKANFMKLVREHFFDSLLFHRVINSFMIQGGDPISKRAKQGDSLGHGELKYTIPAEISKALFHKKGTLCAARESDDINPKYESSPCQFYIVQGKVRTEEDLTNAENRINRALISNKSNTFLKDQKIIAIRTKIEMFKLKNKTDSVKVLEDKIGKLLIESLKSVPEYRFSTKQIEFYKSVGGTPHLDETYTVFGEVIEGLELVDKIAALKTDKRDRPINDIRMFISIE